MKLMFICTGNICRSAMAHKLMEKMIKDAKRKEIDVYSCGVFAQNGDKSTHQAIEVMEEYGVNLKDHTATNIRNAPIQEMELILCMTQSHKYSVLQMYPELQGKVVTLKEYIGEENLDIADPWGYDITIYRFCAAEIEKCLQLLLEKL